MSTAVSTLNDVEVFRNYARVTGQVLKVNLAGLSQADSLVQPTPGGNCLNWVVGHLACVYNNVLSMLGQEQIVPSERLKRYDRGTSALQDPAEALELNELIGICEKALAGIDVGLSALTPERLDEKAPTSPTNNPNETVRSLMTVLGFHQAYHVGQLGILRRIAGKPGAIA
jgi:uncharacterized damage-inducible protein DinB